MTFESERLAIESRFHNNWSTAIKVVYDNMKYTPVADTPYVRLSLENIESRQTSLGNSRLWRNNGLIFIDIFVPEHTGTKILRGYIDTAAAIFRGVTFSGIVCRAPYQPSPGQVLNGWYQMSIAIPYFVDGVY